MASNDLLREVNELAMKAGDGSLTAEEQRRFNDLLETSDEACRTLLLCAMMDAELILNARAEAAEDRAMEQIVFQQPHSVDRGPKLRRVMWGGATAAALVILAVSLLWQTQGQIWQTQGQSVATFRVERQPQLVASLTVAPDAVFLGETRAAGDIFTVGDEIAITSGEAHVSMASGADFVLRSPGALKFVSSSRVELRQGVLMAQVAKWGSGFTVDTAAMRVIDLGTRFAVAASINDVETHVLQGRVRVQPLARLLEGRRSVLLSEGEAIRVGRASDEPTRIAAEKDRFSTPHDVFRPFKPIAIPSTGVGLAEGDEDPNWRITAGPKGASYSGPQFGVVCVPDERYALNEPDRSQWISFDKDVRPGGLANTIYTFETTFDLTGFDVNAVTLAAQILADNGVRAIRINGQEVAFESWNDNVPNQVFSRNSFRLVEIQHGFVPGRNKLEIDVWNGIYLPRQEPALPNPTALRVEFQAFGRLQQSEPMATIAVPGAARLGEPTDSDAGVRHL